ncbi:hypothetical protein N9X90_05050 [Alphaproteobacteria bacterium]|nr:hypothetical protein [Alphaproteobacteria bacterium]
MIIGDVAPNDRQKHLYQTAYDHVMTNIGLIEAGMSFADMTRVSHRLPEIFRPLRYGVLARLAGMMGSSLKNRCLSPIRVQCLYPPIAIRRLFLID